MKWKFWKRDNPDPLVRKFVEYGIHLLPLPREGVSIADVYPVDGETVLEPFNIKYLLKKPIDGLLTIRESETFAGIKGVISNTIQASEGLEFLEGFLGAISGGIVTGLRAHYESKGAHFVKYRFVDPKRNSVDPGELGEKLTKNSINVENPLYQKGRRYYIVTGVMLTNSISVTALDSSAKTINIELGSIAESLTKVATYGSGQSEITYSGGKRLGFGIQVLELKYVPSGDRAESRFTFASAKDMSGFRPGGLSISPSFIGDEEQGNVFIDLPA
jgi:hypothetical protein